MTLEDTQARYMFPLGKIMYTTNTLYETYLSITNIKMAAGDLIHCGEAVSAAP